MNDMELAGRTVSRRELLAASAVAGAGLLAANVGAAESAAVAGRRKRFALVGVEKAYAVVAADSSVLWSNPVFTSASLTPTGFVANVAVVPGEPYRLRASTNLQTWVDVTNFVAAGPSYIVLDPGATNQPLRFYRAESP